MRRGWVCKVCLVRVDQDRKPVHCKTCGAPFKDWIEELENR